MTYMQSYSFEWLSQDSDLFPTPAPSITPPNQPQREIETADPAGLSLHFSVTSARLLSQVIHQSSLSLQVRPFPKPAVKGRGPTGK